MFQVELTEPGICHGFVLWIDWVMDSDNSLVLSTGPGMVQFHVEVYFVLKSYLAFSFKQPSISRSCLYLSFYMFDSDKRYWKQGVKLLANPVAVGIDESRETGEHISTVIEASFDPSNGELIIRNNFG